MPLVSFDTTVKTSESCNLQSPFEIRTREVIGFKSLRIICWEINQAASKCKMYFLDKTCKKMVENRKVNIIIKFYFRSKTEKVNSNIEFCIFEIV